VLEEGRWCRCRRPAIHAVALENARETIYRTGNCDRDAVFSYPDVYFLAFAFKILYWPGAAKLVWIADIGITLSAVLFFIDMLKESAPLKLRLKAIAFFFILNLLFVLFYFAH